MKAKTWLKIFCLEKREMINEITNCRVPLYVNQEDLDEIDTWDSDICYRIIKRMKNNPSDDGAICPWCQHLLIKGDTGNCYNCGYGCRHGFCDIPGSTYQRILSKLPEPRRIWSSCNIKDLPIWNRPFE